MEAQAPQSNYVAERQPSAAANLGDTSSLRIAGFGACMISGYPHAGGGLFETGCRLIEQGLLRPVQSKIVSLGGFPVPRAEKHLRRNVFDFNPHYIVLQFGATDAQCPIRPKNRPDRPRNPPKETSSQSNSVLANAETQNRLRTVLKFLLWETTHDQPYNLLSPLRWEIASVLGVIQKIEPITPLSIFIAAIERIVDDCLSAGMIPVVLSPFIFGSRYTTRNAVLYTNALHELYSRTKGMVFIDCIRVLATFRKSMILMNDGFHLSAAAHNLIGEAIGQSIIADIRPKLLMAA